MQYNNSIELERFLNIKTVRWSSRYNNTLSRQKEKHQIKPERKQNLNIKLSDISATKMEKNDQQSDKMDVDEKTEENTSKTSEKKDESEDKKKDVCKHQVTENLLEDHHEVLHLNKYTYINYLHFRMFTISS